MRTTLLCALFFVGLPAGWAVTSDIRLRGNRLSAYWDPAHTPSSQTIEISAEEECRHRRVSDTELELTGPCEYLGGVYRYLHREGKNAPLHQVLMAFSLSRKASAGHALMVGTPLDIEQTPPPP